MSTTRPLQKIADSKKDSDWKIDCVDYFSQICAFSNQYIWNLYKAANGDLDYLEYNYITNPYGKAVNNRPNLRNFPAKLRNYPIIPQLLNLLMGEKRKRPIVANVKINNGDSYTKLKQAKVDLITKWAQQAYINELNKQGLETGEETKELPELEKALNELTKNWSDPRAIQGSKILDFIRDDVKLDSKFVKGFLDFLVTGSVFSYRDVVRDDIVYQVLSPKNVGYLVDETIDYIEDGEAAAVRLELTISEILDKFYDYEVEDDKKEEFLNYLDTTLGSGTSNVSERKLLMSDVDNGTLYSNNRFNQDSYNGNLNARFNLQANNVLEVIYVNWKSWTQIKQISISSPTGDTEIIEVPHTYEVDPLNGETEIGTYWVNQVWEGYKIANQFYLGIRPISHQRGIINNPSKCKLLINGKVKRVGDVRALSIVELLMPFQHLYNFGHYKLNLTLAKNKDKLLLLPMGMLPKEEGWDMYTSMYFADSTGILYVDDSDKDNIAALQQVKSIDMSLSNYIQFMYEYLNNIKAEAKELIGITRQREGNTTPSEGLGTSERSIFQGTLITEDMYAQYDEFQEVDMNALLDLSRYAYRNGKRAAYVSPEGRNILLAIDADDLEFQNAQFGIRIVSSFKEQEKFNMLKDFAHAFAQNDARPSTIAKILNASGSFFELEDKLEEIEKMEMEIAQQNQGSEQDHALELQQLKNEALDKQIEMQKYKIDEDNKTKIIVAEISASKGMSNTPIDSDNDGQITELDILGHELKEKEVAGKLNIEQQKINQKDREIASKEKIEAMKANTAIKVAKENKSEADLKAKSSGTK